MPFVLESHCYDTADAMTHSQRENLLMTHAGRSARSGTGRVELDRVPAQLRKNLIGCISETLRADGFNKL